MRIKVNNVRCNFIIVSFKSLIRVYLGLKQEELNEVYMNL